MTNLSKYLSYGYTNRVSKIFSKVLPEQLLISLFIKIEADKKNNEFAELETITLPTINTSNELVSEFKEILSKFDFENNITLAAFGSLATNELIKYSDFDGILIYKEKSFINHSSISKLRKLISEINLTAHLQDSLQHHGIIVISDVELLNQPNDITVRLIKESKVIYGLTNIKIAETKISQYNSSLSKLINSIQNKLQQQEKWTNQYYFKNLLSELLLLPCSYLQHKTDQYISKKDSFELIKNYVSIEELTLINQLENIRKDWNQPALNKKELSNATIQSIKNNSKTQAEAINKLSEIKENLSSFIIRLTPND